MILLVMLCAADVWTKLPPLPDREGFAGSFAGVSDGVLLVAGGANFPGKRPWDGGKKAWYDTVWALDKPFGEWKVVGKLPRPMGYGVSVSQCDSLVCVGGADGERHHADTFRLTLKRGKLVVTKLSPLPRPLANACGAMLDDDWLYVVGGQETPDGPTVRTAYRVSLDGGKWERIEDVPGPGRMLSVAAGLQNALFVVGGVDVERGKRVYLRDVHRYDPGLGWVAARPLPHALAAGPSPAPTEERAFSVIGGDDGSQVGVAPEKHRGFAKSVLRYDLKDNMWTVPHDIEAPRVTVPCVRWFESWVIPSGEARPGVRSPDVWRYRPVVRP